MKTLSFLMITAGTFGLTHAAQAADMPPKAVHKAPIAAAQDWTGFYVGGHVGGGWGKRTPGYTGNDLSTAQLLDPILGAAAPSGSFTTSGAIGGLQVGYNRQFSNNWLAGFEADFSVSGMKGSGTFAGTNGNVDVSTTASEEVKWFGTVRARLGYLPTENLLAYVTGGFAYGQVARNARYDNIDPTAGFGIGNGGISFNCSSSTNCFSGSSRDTALGWTAGGGFEYALSRNLTLRTEYFHVSLESSVVTETARVPLNAGETRATLNADLGRTSFNVVRMGVNYRF